VTTPSATYMYIYGCVYMGPYERVQSRYVPVTFCVWVRCYVETPPSETRTGHIYDIVAKLTGRGVCISGNGIRRPHPVRMGYSKEGHAVSDAHRTVFAYQSL
jgi:hypothetical protein